MKFASVLLVALAVAVAIPSLAGAAMISVWDRRIPGSGNADGNLTTDTETGLQWLVPNVPSQLDLDPYPFTIGFRYATRLEVHGFLTHLGLPTGVFPNGGFAPVDLYTAAAPYLGQPFYNWIMYHSSLTIWGLTGDLSPSGQPYAASVELLTDYDSITGAMTVRTFTSFSGTGIESPSQGHWMVRAVPEPSTWTLAFLAALALLACGVGSRVQHHTDAPFWAA